MTDHHKSSWLHAWDFFCSLKLALFTLIMLALTSIIGTVIQQNRPPEESLALYGEKLYKLFDSLQFFNMYHSSWFLTLLLLFCVNLTCCSIKRLPRVWKAYREPMQPADEQQFKLLGNKASIDSPLAMQEARDKVTALLSKSFGKPSVQEQDGKLHLLVQKAPWARFGVYVTHLSILLIFAGAIIGNIWGFKGFVNIVEGETVNQVWSRTSNAPIDLGFAVRCDDFSVSYYAGSNRPREFASILDVIDGDQQVIRDRKIVVNDPLTYKGITFYQSSYGQAGDASFTMRVTPKGGAPVEVRGKSGEQVQLPGGYTFAVTGYAPDYQGLGPALQMRVNTPDGRLGNPFVIFQKFPEFDARRGGAFAFALLDYQEKHYTGLQVKKDPGVEVVWAGCILMVVGTLVAFFLSHRRLWVVIEPAAHSCRVQLGGSAHRNQPGFALYFERLRQDLEKALNA